MEVRLRSECQSLLEKLQTSQQLLTGHVTSQVGDLCITTTDPSPQNPSQQSDSIPQAHSQDSDPIINYNLSRKGNKKSLRQKFGTDITSVANVSKDAETDLKPIVARNKLFSLTKNDKGNDAASCEKKVNGKENCHSDRSDLLKDVENSVNPSSWQPATPNKQRRRQLIDKHTSVPTNLSDKELNDLNNERNLNFNYSYINIDDNVTHLRSTVSDVVSEESTSKQTEISKPVSGSEELPKDVSLVERQEERHRQFNDNLLDDGNNRKLGKFIKHATVKPKSILNSTAYYSLNSSKRNNSRVQFDSTQSDVPVPDHRLLGYDWIAALLDNDSNMVNQSESFFDDLRDFRKAHKQECSNQFYMESPHTLVDTEPPEVAEALSEPKVRPYIVNERLFTEPFKSNLIPNEDEDIHQKQGKEPSKENPRFVRVSIPRSTLQTPYRVKPHRRGSFDAADSCALMDHCLLGWENTRPEMLPAASSLDLNTEAGTRQDSVVTSLAEAEKLATAPRHSAWPFAKPQGRVTTLPAWRKHYTDTTLNLTQPSLSVSSGGAGGTSGKRATDRLLHATYSNMYEMERLRQERELESKREEGVRKAWKS